MIQLQCSFDDLRILAVFTTLYYFYYLYSRPHFDHVMCLQAAISLRFYAQVLFTFYWGCVLLLLFCWLSPLLKEGSVERAGAVSLWWEFRLFSSRFLDECVARLFLSWLAGRKNECFCLFLMKFCLLSWPVKAGSWRTRGSTWTEFLQLSWCHWSSYSQSHFPGGLSTQWPQESGRNRSAPPVDGHWLWCCSKDPAEPGKRKLQNVLSCLVG